MNVEVKVLHFDTRGNPVRAQFTADGKMWLVEGTAKIRSERARVNAMATRAAKPKPTK
jgi:hypothetical protein